jgi:hypothetical protein
MALAAASLVAAGGLCLWGARVLNINDASLVGVGQPEMSSYDCLVGGRLVRPGPAMRVNTEWIIDDDLVPVLASLRRQGWQSSTHMTTNIQMLPNSPTALDMGLLRVHVFRALSLSYTQAGTTRVAASTRFVACPP